MFIKTAQIYTLGLDVDQQQLEQALSQKRARPCGDNELSTLGFAAPIGQGEDAPLVHRVANYMMIRLNREERIIPASAVRDMVREKVDEIEARDLRKVYKKERDAIKDDVIMQCIPRAFIRKSSIQAIFLCDIGMLVVSDTGNKAEDLLSMVRECLGSFPVRPLATISPPATIMTDWTRNGCKPFSGLNVGADCELRDTESGIVRCVSQDITSEEVTAHIAAGMHVCKIGLYWADKLSFTLDESLVLRKIRFGDLISTEIEQQAGDSQESYLDASFAITAGTLAQVIPVLTDFFGGQLKPASI